MKPLVNATGAFGTSLYQVSTDKTLGQYSTIQAAIDAAHTAGASVTNQKFVMISTGTYTENLTLYDGVNLTSANPNNSQNNGSPVITGSHTLSGSTNINFQNLTLLNTTAVDVFTLANTCTLTFLGCFISDNGTGLPTFFNISSGSANANINFYNGTNCTYQGNLINQSNGYCGLVLSSTFAGGLILLDSTVNTVQFNFNIYNSTYGGNAITITGDNCFFALFADNSAISCDIDGTNSNSNQTLTFHNCFLATSMNGWKWKLATLIANNSSINSYNSSTFIDDTSGSGGSTYTYEACTFYCPNLGNLKGSTTVIHSGSLAGSGAPTLTSGATIDYVGCVGFSGNSVLAHTIANATNATDGFLYLPSCAGAPSGVPTVYGAGIPLVIDSSDNLPYFYNGSWHPISGSVVFSGDAGSFTSNAVTIHSNQTANNAGASVFFDATTPNMTLNVTDANQSTFIGSLCGTTLGSFSNTAVGFQCMPVANTSSYSCAFGEGALLLETSGMNNCAFGVSSLNTIDGGSNNSVFGFNAGQGLITTDSNNICIGAYALGNPGVSNSTIIGDGTQTTCYIGGIITADSSTFGTALGVYIDSVTGQLGYGSAGGGTTFTADNGTPFSSSSVTITAGNSTNISGASVVFNATSPNVSFSVTDANNNTFIGYLAGNNTNDGTPQLCTAVGQNSLSMIGSSGGASGQYLTALGNNSGKNILAGAYGIFIGFNAGSEYIAAESGNICIGAYGNATENNVTRIGYFGNSLSQTKCYIDGINTVDSSLFSSPLPVYVDTTTGQLGYGSAIGVLGCDDFGTVTGTQVNILAYAVTNVCGSSVRFTSSMGNTLTLNVTDGNQNTILGLSAGNSGISGVNNTGIGDSIFLALTTGSGNFAGSNLALASLRDGSANIAVGSAALSASVSDNGNVAIGGEVFLSLNGGSSNIGIGYGIAELLLTGSNNILIGNQCANNYTGAESGNIIIGSGTPGNTGENNITTIGFNSGSPSQAGCYIDGINNVSSSGFTTPKPISIDLSTGQLGYADSLILSTSGLGAVSATTGTIQAVGINAQGGVFAESYINTAGSAPTNSFYKSRSTTVGSFVTVQTNDTLGRLEFYGDDGTQFSQVAAMVIQASGTISTGIVPGIITFQTANASGSLVGALTIDQNQLVTANSLASLSTLKTAPPASNTATTGFGSIAIGTALQNTLGYDILVNISVNATVATGATIVMGIGSTNTPTTNAVTGSFSTGLTSSFSAIVPAGYYILVNTTGTITVGSITTQVCAL